MQTLEDVQTWPGLKMVDADGDKIGKIEHIYLDRQTGEPEWATVRTGLFGTRVSFVPISDAQKTDNDTVRVGVQKEQVKDAPGIEAGEELSPEEEQRLYEHYGRSDYGQWQGEDRTQGLDLPAEQSSGERFQRPEAGEARGRPGGEGDAPVLVGVRLRRYVIVAPTPGDDESQRG